MSCNHLQDISNKATVETTKGATEIGGASTCYKQIVVSVMSTANSPAHNLTTMWDGSDVVWAVGLHTNGRCKWGQLAAEWKCDRNIWTFSKQTAAWSIIWIIWTQVLLAIFLQKYLTYELNLWMQIFDLIDFLSFFWARCCNLLNFFTSAFFLDFVHLLSRSIKLSNAHAVE